MTQLIRHNLKNRFASVSFYSAIGFAALVIGWLIGLFFIWLLSNGSQLDPAHALLLTNPQIQGEFTLANTDGDLVHLSDYQGQVTLVYYGYTFCPDVCPATLLELSNMMDTLGRKANKVQVLMVTVDPERDGPEMLEEYVTYFHPTFIGLTGTQEQLIAATSPYGIFYEKKEGNGNNYFIDHSAGVLVFDRSGRLRMMFPFGVKGEDMAADISPLIR